ncbi:MAG: tRNA glutamyl-Q(34) synthetase GluQRS [Desulfuromonas sp.]|nr:MAG: tRNA glutamyl-Q(34) synthetase GluQRS [Desulfuromonas sp.]
MPDMGAITRTTVGRFAPSPSGPLHLGSLVTALGSYCHARQRGGLWRLRIEDLDTPRVVPGAAETILKTLEHLGFEWDGEVVWQSRRFEAYAATLHQLKQDGWLFDCGCSRREILASAPHAGEEGPVYPGTCRHGLPPGRQARSQRLRVDSGLICFADGLYGQIEQSLQSAVGDFVLRRGDGVYAYQLAVVVDDHAAGITDVVRGADLLWSTPRQIHLHACLGHSPPHYIHLPLVLGNDGEKLSKRHQQDVPVSSDPHLLWQALNFLAQAPPKEMCRASAREILAWGVENFSLARIRPVDQTF